MQTEGRPLPSLGNNDGNDTYLARIYVGSLYAGRSLRVWDVSRELQPRGKKKLSDSRLEGSIV